MSFRVYLLPKWSLPFAEYMHKHLTWRGGGGERERESERDTTSCTKIVSAKQNNDKIGSTKKVPVKAKWHPAKVEQVKKTSVKTAATGEGGQNP